MSEPIPPRLEEVFGIRTVPVLSYVTRDDVDGAFERAIASEHHVVVYGSSKQGKTALRQTHVPDPNCVVVRCNPRHGTTDIYSSLLRQTNVRIEALAIQTQTSSGRVKGSLGFRAKIPFFGGADANAELEAGKERQQQLQTEFVGYDFGDAQAISELLQQIGFKKFVVLENFHYLPEDTQRQLAFDLKTFHEVNIRFIILGIWQEANLLTTHNGDLQDRVIEVQVEPWLPEDFRKLAAAGSYHLNIELAPKVVEEFIDHAYGNVGMVQEFLSHFCQIEGVFWRQDLPRILDSLASVAKAFDQKLDTQRVALVKALQAIAARSRIRRGEADPLLLPYYLVLAILRTPVERLREGLDRNALLDALRQVHHRADKETIRGGDLTNLLVHLPAHQDGIHPPLLYYDNNSRRLRIVDTRQFFVLANANRKELEDEIPAPSAPE